MKEWKVSEAKAQFSAMLHEAEEEPQMIRRRDLPVAVVLGMAAYEKTARAKQPSVSQMLQRLRRIQEAEQVEIEIPHRADRAMPGLAD